ncbi:hypothetical protein FB451DRAFT_1172236 [Mycena latifolia]|nr:hypothetical protein FB451DRAFT_1172236 [Mycena latifolia]
MSSLTPVEAPPKLICTVMQPRGPWAALGLHIVPSRARPMFRRELNGHICPVAPSCLPTSRISPTSSVAPRSPEALDHRKPAYVVGRCGVRPVRRLAEMLEVLGQVGGSKGSTRLKGMHEEDGWAGELRRGENATELGMHGGARRQEWRVPRAEGRERYIPQAAGRRGDETEHAEAGTAARTRGGRRVRRLVELAHPNNIQRGARALTKRPQFMLAAARLAEEKGKRRRGSSGAGSMMRRTGGARRDGRRLDGGSYIPAGGKSVDGHQWTPLALGSHWWISCAIVRRWFPRFGKIGC